MSYRVTVEELRKGAPPLRMISLTGADWLQAIDAVTEVLSREDSYFNQDDEEQNTASEPEDELLS